MTKKTYYAAAEGFIQGRHYAAGAPVEMTEAQAKYLLLDGTVTSDNPKERRADKRPTPTPVKQPESDSKVGE